MYTLMLTADERRAFDWVGYRSNAGEIAGLLSDCIVSAREWSDDGTIILAVPEHVAWQINDLAEGDDCAWPCFGPELARKMQEFVDSIV